MTFGKKYCPVCGHKFDIHTYHKSIAGLMVYVCEGVSEFCGCTQGYGEDGTQYLIPDPKS